MRYIWLVAVLFLLLGLPVLAGPNEAIAAARADARSLPASLAYRTRYIDLSVYTDSERKLYLPAYRGHLAELSRRPLFLPPRVLANGLVLAVVLDHYDWDAKVWDRMDADPYYYEWRRESDGWQYSRPGHWLDYALFTELSRLTKSRAPIVSGDFWFVYTSRQLGLDNKELNYGYYDFLGIKKRADFEELGGTDKKVAIKLGLEQLAAIRQGKSRISQLDRGVKWFRVLTGSLYLTEDTDSIDNGNLIVAKLGRDRFKHKAEEGYINLPNGMWAFWLGDEKGNRQNTAPDFIGPDDSPLRQGRDARIHICQGCRNCHINGGLQSMDDWARQNIRKPNELESYDYGKLLELYQQYAGDLERQIERDRTAHREALLRYTGLTPEQYAKRCARIYYAYFVEEWTLVRLARRAGVNQGQLVKSLRSYAAKHEGFDDRLAPLGELVTVPPGGLPVGYAEQMWPYLQQILRSY